MDATELESLYHSVQEPAPAGAGNGSGEQAAETEDVAGSATDAARRAGSRIRTNR